MEGGTSNTERSDLSGISFQSCGRRNGTGNSELVTGRDQQRPGEARIGQRAARIDSPTDGTATSLRPADVGLEATKPEAKRSGYSFPQPGLSEHLLGSRGWGRGGEPRRFIVSVLGELTGSGVGVGGTENTRASAGLCHYTW